MTDPTQPDPFAAPPPTAVPQGSPQPPAYPPPPPSSSPQPGAYPPPPMGVDAAPTPGYAAPPAFSPPPPSGQAPYGQPPYGQAPYGQPPYGQAPYGVSGIPGTTPGARRSRTPIVLAVVGSVLVVGLAVTAALVISQRGGDDSNEAAPAVTTLDTTPSATASDAPEPTDNGVVPASGDDDYVGAPISSTDQPVSGDVVHVSPSGLVAFEGMNAWTDMSSLVDTSTMLDSEAGDMRALGTYFTSDPFTAEELPPLVMVLEGDLASLKGITAEQFHALFVKGASQTSDLGQALWVSDTESVTTASGLTGYKTEASFEDVDFDAVASWYTFARGNTLVVIQIAEYNGVEDPALEALFFDTLRIDAA